MSRALSIRGRKSGLKKVLSVGRVQTPVLALVVERHQRIHHFRAVPFYELVATIELDTTPQHTVKAKWLPSEACSPYCDEEGRVLSKALIENVARRIQDKPAKVLDFSQKQKRLPPPLPFNLSSLQIEANNRFKLSAKQVLDSCQALYEKHKLITYPRSDCQYLPNAHHAQGRVIGGNLVPLFAEALNGVALNYSQKSRAWSDKNVGAHHAIIPTQREPRLATLSHAEQNIYRLVAARYLMQFLSNEVSQNVVVIFEIEGGQFKRSATQQTEPGWKVLQSNKPPQAIDMEKLLACESKPEARCSGASIETKATQPPKPYTEATLLAAMTGIARLVSDKALKKILRDTDGLGTEATRAGIIELLIKRGFIERDKRLLQATSLGIQLINHLPANAQTADMTALWESRLKRISEKRESYQQFMVDLEQSIQTMVEQCEQIVFKQNSS